MWRKTHLLMHYRKENKTQQVLTYNLNIHIVLKTSALSLYRVAMGLCVSDHLIITLSYILVIYFPEMRHRSIILSIGTSSGCFPKRIYRHSSVRYLMRSIYCHNSIVRFH